MVKGDVVGGSSSVTTGAELSVQPAAGVEYIITSAHLSAAATTSINLALNGSPQTPVKLPVSNSLPAGIRNADGSTQYVNWLGIQVK